MHGLILLNLEEHDRRSFPNFELISCPTLHKTENSKQETSKATHSSDQPNETILSLSFGTAMASPKVSTIRKSFLLDHYEAQHFLLSSVPETLPSRDHSSPFVGFFPRPHYDWTLSTEDNYRTSHHDFFGRLKKIRQRLDHNYHANYSRARQSLQDAIIESMLQKNSTKGLNDNKDTRPLEYSVLAEPWIIFTAGVMGAGKSYTIRQLHANGQFPLESFVTVDPDEIRRLLPEFNVYVRTCPEKAGELTRKEAGMMAEILTEAALERGQNVLVDGSLRDAAWYQNYFTVLRHSFPSLKLGIIHITAPIEAIFERVKVRSVGRLSTTRKR